MLFFLIKFSSGQLNTPLNDDDDRNRGGAGSEGAGGLCSGVNATADHPLRDLGGLYHTPWLDSAFCKYVYSISFISLIIIPISFLVKYSTEQNENILNSEAKDPLLVDLIIW